MSDAKSRLRWPRTSIILGIWPTENLSIISLLAEAVANGVVTTLIASLPLYLGWRLVGAGAEYRRIAVPLCYQSAIATLLISAGFVATSTPLIVAEPHFFERMREVLIREGDPVAKWSEAWRMVEWLQKARGAAAMSGDMLMMLIYLVLLGWLVVSRGAYRQALGIVARWRSLVAFMAFSALVITTGGSFVAIASWLSRPG